MERDAIDFGTEKVSTLFKKLFFPTLLGMLGMSAMTAIDGIFIGHSVGSDGIAAVNIICPPLMLLTGLGLMTGTGCSVVASIHLSRGKTKAARLNVTQAFLFATAAAAVPVALLLGFTDEAARLLGSSEHLLPLVRDYIVWNVPSWVFIVYILRHAKTLRLAPLKTSRTSIRLTARNIGYQCRIGSSALLGEATLAVLILMGNFVFMRYLGDDGVGAFGIACYYTPFIFMVGNAIAQSAQPIISYNFGLGASARVRQAERTALVTAAVCGLVVVAAFTGLPGWLVGLFVSLDNGAARIAVDGFPYFAAGFVFFIFNLTAIGYFQSVERIRTALTFAMMRGFVLLVPSFLIVPGLLGTHGIWLAMPVAECLTALSVAAFYAIKRRSGTR